MSLVFYFQGKAFDGVFQIGDVGSRNAVSSGEDSGELSPVIGKHQRKAVQLPGKPHLFVLRPLYQLGNQLCLCKGKGRKLMGFPFSVILLITGIPGRTVRKDISALRFQGEQFVKQGVPLIVGHDFLPAVIIRLRSLVQPSYQFFASYFIVFHPVLFSF